MSETDQSIVVEGVPTFPEVLQHVVRPTDPVIGTVVESRVCTKSKKAAGFVRHIEIDVSGTALEGAWVSGQSFGVVPPGLTEAGKPHKLRLYSIAAPTGGETGDGTIISTTLKRVVDEHWEDHTLFQGLCSNYLADLQIGDKVHLTGPAGKRFLLPADPAAHNYIFIATGTGIAPFRSMLGDLVKLGMPSRVDLIMGVPYESDLLYDEDFKELAEDYPGRFHYRTAISRHTTPGQPKKLYVQGRLQEDASVLVEILKSDRTLIYICGIAGMELGILQTLAGVLDPKSLSQYLTIDPEIGTDPGRWNRKMIPRTLKPTKRMFLEVY
ncbi:MAG: hypothetical protein JKY43_07150 [Phycisphaerales bacterium]|nr:hypothetical protein [Phycisphaerales bacterium]